MTFPDTCGGNVLVWNPKYFKVVCLSIYYSIRYGIIIKRVHVIKSSTDGYKQKSMLFSWDRERDPSPGLDQGSLTLFLWVSGSLIQVWETQLFLQFQNIPAVLQLSILIVTFPCRRKCPNLPSNLKYFFYLFSKYFTKNISIVLYYMLV